MKRFVLIILFALAGIRCESARNTPDWSDCPRLVSHSVQKYPLPAERPLELTFDHPVFPQEGAGEGVGVFLVPQTDAGPCNPACPTECFADRCFLSEVDAAFLEDATGGDLSVSRAQKSLDLKIEIDGAVWKLTPKRGSLTPSWRYDLVLSPGIRDLRGLPLLDADGRASAFSLTFATAPADDLPAAVEWIAPRSAARGVPQNLTFLALKIQGEGASAPGTFILETKDKQVLELTATPFEAGCVGAPPGTECLLLWIPSMLTPDTSYELRTIRRLRLSGGRYLLPWGRLGSFATGELSWLYPPRWEEGAPSEVTGCVHLSGTLEGEALLWLEAGGAAVSPAAFVRYDGAELAARASGLRVRGLGLEGTPFMGRLQDLEPGDASWFPVVIARVHPNPVGPEPAQEFVELVNVSDGDVELEGWELTDSLEKPGDLLPPFRLAAGGLVRVAGKNYDPGSEVDPPPEGDLIVLDSSLANAGLGNGGEPLYLFDAFGMLVSRYGGWIDTGDDPGLSVRRTTLYACDVATSWILR